MTASVLYHQYKQNLKLCLITSVLLFIIEGCWSHNNAAVNGLHFTLLSSDETNISFNNKVTESDSVNFFTNEYMYIGAGVGVGDFNNDGLQDVFFCGSETPSKVYKNKGNFKFEDVTENSGIHTTTWCLGVSVIDINNDGLQDIYVCVSQSPKGSLRKNLLYINKGNFSFTEEAEDYGIADTGFSTQATFFDYDNDGDLDMYLLNHRLYNPSPNNLSLTDTSGNSPAEDKLYRNDGAPAGKTHPVFGDVSNAAGIKEDGYGLGIIITDINKDGWQDIYVANDYIANDLLWLNNGNGTFTNIIGKATRHESYNSMGVDAADINNDGLADIAVLDMLPETNMRKKIMFSGTGAEKYYMQSRLNYQPSFTRNMLQLNNGNRFSDNKQEPFFSEIGQLAGISETDWSWSVLLADFDNDGWKDMHVTNGISRDLTNTDFVQFKQGGEDNSYNFGGGAPAANTNSKAAILQKLNSYGVMQQQNYFFINNHSLGFTNITDSVGMNKLSVSQGCTYSDLDNDGDLDLIVNNMNEDAFVWRNDLRKTAQDSTNKFITVVLKGDQVNESGIGAKLFVYDKNGIQYFEQQPVRGYLSSVDNRIHIGTGNAKSVDSIVIEWPGAKKQLLKNVNANQTLVLEKKNAIKSFNEIPSAAPTMFTEVSAKMNIDFTHNELAYFDFGNQRVLPQKYSQLGPCIATADINGDGLEDFFVGGAANQSGKLFIQNQSGAFISRDLITGKKITEDIGAVFFDADGDKDADLLVTCGSSEFNATDSVNAPYLFLNDGKGNFNISKMALPQNIRTVASVVSVCDYDNDEDTDVFIGGRIVPGKYPASPDSYILQNNKGVFTDVTENVCPALKNAGMITSAVWSDFDGNGVKDLVICGEWMPVRFFKNSNGKLTEIITNPSLASKTGMWRSLEAVDIDNDGDMDFVAGNMGINNKYHLEAGPSLLYVKDIDKNGYNDLIPAYCIKDNEGRYQEFPGIDRGMLAEEAPAVKKKYLLSEDFAKVNMQQLTDDYGKDGWTIMKCETMESIWIENLGNAKFKTHPLPIKAQFAPINAIVAADVNGDGNIDLVLAGNEYQIDINTGRYDASYGLILADGGKKNFLPVNITRSGFIVEGDVKALKTIHSKKYGSILVAAVNDDKVKCFALSK